MKAAAFAPGHISCFFEPVYHNENIFRTGSRGAGINITLGTASEVTVETAKIQNIDIYVNDRKTPSPVTNLALKYLLGENPLKVVVKTKQNLPTGQGFGMSAAGALSATLALSKITDVSRADAMKASHFAEVKLRTGLGDVMASCFGGIEIRKTPGLPPWGIIEHIPGDFNLVLCVLWGKLNTKKILLNSEKTEKIVEYGSYCTKKILENPSVENLFYLAQVFTKKTNLADKKVLDAMKSVEKYGNASMCMLGNSIFAMGETEKICRILGTYGRVFICNVDQNGARVLDL